MWIGSKLLGIAAPLMVAQIVLGQLTLPPDFGSLREAEAWKKAKPEDSPEVVKLKTIWRDNYDKILKEPLEITYEITELSRPNDVAVYVWNQCDGLFIAERIDEGHERETDRILDGLAFNGRTVSVFGGRSVAWVDSPLRATSRGAMAAVMMNTNSAQYNPMWWMFPYIGQLPFPFWPQREYSILEGNVGFSDHPDRLLFDQSWENPNTFRFFEQSYITMADRASASLKTTSGISQIFYVDRDTLMPMSTEVLSWNQFRLGRWDPNAPWIERKTDIDEYRKVMSFLFPSSGVFSTWQIDRQKAKDGASDAVRLASSYRFTVVDIRPGRRLERNFTPDVPNRAMARIEKQMKYLSSTQPASK